MQMVILEEDIIVSINGLYLNRLEIDEQGKRTYIENQSIQGIDVSCRMNIDEEILKEKGSFTYKDTTVKIKDKCSIKVRFARKRIRINKGIRFIFYSFQRNGLWFSIRLTEKEENAFGFVPKPVTSKKKTKSKKKNRKNKDTAIDKRNKWALSHTFQGGSFSPR